MRFDPPAFATPPGLRWALVRAFGPSDAPWRAPPSGREALTVARQFDLAPRIGGRHCLDALASEVGARAAAAFALEHGMARRTAAGLAELAAAVAATAAGLGVPLVLLKFAALQATGRVADGLRLAGDVDVLVPAAQAPALAEALAPLGLRPAGFSREPHQLPQLRDDLGRRLELHLYVPGVRLPASKDFAAVGALREAGLVQRTGLPGECFAPTAEVMTAHVIVHAIAQHGFAPHVYPAFRLVADLIDLGAHADGGGLARAAAPLVSGEVSADEIGAALALVSRLARADMSLFEDGGSSSPEGALLRHLVAGRLDRDYARALRARGLARKARTPFGLTAEAARALWPTNAQIDVIYGPPHSRYGYVGRRAARPFDLARRAARYAVASLRLWLRQRRA